MSSTKQKIQTVPEAFELVSARVALRYSIFPLRVEKETLIVAMADPDAYDVLDELRMILGRSVQGTRVHPGVIGDAIREYYGVGADTLDSLAVTHDVISVQENSFDSTIDDAAAEASIIKFVNQIIVDAYTNRATDIHLEPFENCFRVRYRIDGVLCNASIPESIRHFRDAIISRIKIMANLDIAERRLPQDGRIRVKIDTKDFDLRVSVIPIAHGESINIRILQRSNVLMGLDAIGFDETAIMSFRQLLKKPHGIILLTGPTGSGKTTTLYACLSKLNAEERKIITIEDPVEYLIQGICQMQAKPDIGFTFASGLKCMLRHDPDVMLVGEIRDFETAELAIRCALTGHLVFSTLHTNDAPGAVPRLLDIGIEPYLLSSSVEAVIAQRLVRLICTHCARPDQPTREVLAEAELDVDTGICFMRGTGCERCRNTGYFGRTAIYEMLLLDDEIRGLIMERAPGSRIRHAGIIAGMQTLRANGFEKAKQGLTTIDEVLRVTQKD